MPSAQQVATAYPERANRERVQGTGRVTCTVAANGSLTNCEVASEDPAGYGFAQATLSLTNRFRLRMPGPVAAGGSLVLPMSFRLPAGETPTPPAPEGTIPNAAWATTPTVAQVAAVYPAASPQETRVHAFVVLDCTTNEAGVPGDCNTAMETPAGRGFGDAAKRLTGLYRLAATQPGGVPVSGAKVRLLISF
jgi:TonB family protein